MSTNRPKLQFDDTAIFILRNHFRLHARVYTLEIMVRELWLSAKGLPDDDDTDRQFEEKLASIHELNYGRVLEQIESVLPGFAAQLDERSVRDVEQSIDPLDDDGGKPE